MTATRSHTLTESLAEFLRLTLGHPYILYHDDIYHHSNNYFSAQSAIVQISMEHCL